MEKFKFHETQRLKDLTGESNQPSQLAEDSLKAISPARWNKFFHSCQVPQPLTAAYGQRCWRLLKKIVVLSKNTALLARPRSLLLKQFPKKPTRWWLPNWRTADPVRVGWLPRPQKSFQEIRRHREGRVSKNITLQEISLKEPDRSKDSCRKLCRRCEVSLEDFKISRGSNKRNRGHWEF